MTPAYRFGASPLSQAQCHHVFLSSFCRDQRDGDHGMGPSMEKQEVTSEVSMQNDLWGSSNGHFFPPPSSSSTIRTAAVEGGECCGDSYGKGWTSSKMRFMQKMKGDNGPSHCTGPTTLEGKTIEDVIRSNDRAAISTNSGGSNHVMRVCFDCNTTTTPLWRSGPRGPKSLCNACGIRQRKARRAMEEAAALAGEFNPTLSSSVMSRINGSKVHNKEKKLRGAGHSVLSPTSKKTTKAGGGGSDGLFGDFSALRGAFPRDVTEAAILLMDLSCGFAHT